MYDAILDYGRRLYNHTVASPDIKRLEQLRAAANQIQNIADTIAISLGTLVREWRDRKLKASDETRNMFVAFHRQVTDAIAAAVRALEDNDPRLAATVVAMKPEIAQAADALVKRIGERMLATDPDRPAVYRLEVDVIEIFKRLCYFATRLAKTVATDGV